MTKHEIVLDVLRTLNKPSTLKEIESACDLSYSQIANACSELVRMDSPRIQRVSKGVYQLTDTGSPQLPVKQHIASLLPLPDAFPDTSQTRAEAESFFSDQLKLWQLHKNISSALQTLAPYNLPLPTLTDPEEAMLFVDAIAAYVYGSIEYTELLDELTPSEKDTQNGV